MSTRGLAAILLLLLPLSVYAENGDEAQGNKAEQPPGTPDPLPAPEPEVGTSLSVDQAFIRRLPMNHSTGGNGEVNRAFQDLAELLAPGVQRDASGISIDGMSSAEIEYRVDGLSTRHPAFGTNASALNVEFLEAVDIIRNGYLPEHGRTYGGLISAVTSTGSNAFHGSVFAHWAPGALEEQSEPISSEGSVIQGARHLKNLGDLGTTLGGPILRDRLWFFAGFVPSFTRTTYIREFKDIPGPTSTYFFDAHSLQGLLKLTYRPATDHTVSVSLFSTRSSDDNRGPLEGPPPAPAVISPKTTSNAPAATLTYTGAFLARKVLVEAQAGWFHYDVSRLFDLSSVKRTGLSDSWRARGAQQTSDCGDDLLRSDPMDRYQLHAKATSLLTALGTHELKVGADAEFLVFAHERASWDVFSLSLVCERVRTSSRSNTVGGFLQDSWSLTRRVTLNIGVRYDVQVLHYPPGRRFSDQDRQEQVLHLGHQISPRAGIVVDPMADGRVKVFLHLARYDGQVPLGQVDEMARFELFADPALRPPSSTEFMAGAGYEPSRHTRLGVSYTHRSLNRAVEEVSLDGGFSFFLGNPGLGQAERLPKPVRTYDAATLSLSHAFAEGWLAQASYTLSRLHGNYLGPYPEGPEALWRPLGWSLPDASRGTDRLGLLPLDRTHSFKLFGAREFYLSQSLSTSVGVSYRGSSGTPINYYGAHPEYGQDAVLILQRGSGGRTPWVHTVDSTLGVHYRLGADHVVSLTLGVFNLFNFEAVTRVDETYTGQIVFPLKNGTPADLPDEVMLNNASGGFLTASDSDVNPNFRRPVQRQAPRRLRLGIRYTF